MQDGREPKRPLDRAGKKEWGIDLVCKRVMLGYAWEVGGNGRGDSGKSCN